jgi:hypothetical protein
MTAPLKPAKLPHKVYGWNACKLADKLTQAQLLELMHAVQNDPASANPGHATGSIWLYTKAARKKLDVIGWAITYQLGGLAKNAPVHPAYDAPVERTQCR